MQNVPIADLAALQLQMFCFHLLPQVHHRKANKGQDLHSAWKNSTFLNEPTPWVWVLLGTVDLTVGDTLVIQILSQLRPAGMPVPAHYPQSQLDLEGLWSLLGKMDQNGVKDGHVRNARSLCLCEDPSGLPSLSLPSCDESKKFLVV